MPPSARPTLLVIPAYRESQRLPKSLPELCATIDELGDGSVAVRVVDDGSGEQEQKVVGELVGKLQEKYDFLLDPLLLEKNRGKGGAVYAGWDDSKGEDYEKLGFVDADGAVSPEEVVRLQAMIPELGEGECLYAARLHDEDGPAIKRTWIRKWLGLLFRKLTRMFFRLPIRDSQCGFKFVDTPLYRESREHLTEFRYCFDIDLTIHLIKAGATIREEPISWVETPGTKLNLSQASKMLSSLWALRKKR